MGVLCAGLGALTKAYVARLSEDTPTHQALQVKLICHSVTSLTAAGNVLLIATESSDMNRYDLTTTYQLLICGNMPSAEVNQGGCSNRS